MHSNSTLGVAYQYCTYFLITFYSKSFCFCFIYIKFWSVNEWIRYYIIFILCFHRDFCKMALAVVLWSNSLACQHELSTSVRRNQDPISTWTPSFRYKDRHYEYKMVVRLSYPYKWEILYTGLWLSQAHREPGLHAWVKWFSRASMQRPQLALQEDVWWHIWHCCVFCCLTTCWVIMDVLTFQGSLFQASHGNKPQQTTLSFNNSANKVVNYCIAVGNTGGILGW